jgi:hypothetical protein
MIIIISNNYVPQVIWGVLTSITLFVCSSSSSVTISKGIDGKVGDGWDSEVIWKSTFGEGEGVIVENSGELLLMDGICGELVVGISV